MEAESQHTEYIVRVFATFTRLQHAVGEEESKCIGAVLKEAKEAAIVPGRINEEMSSRFTAALNELGRKIESDPDEFFESLTGASSRRAYAHG